MSARNYRRHDHINGLIFQYEAMSQQGTVCFLEKAVFWQLIDYYQEREEIAKAIEVVENATRQHLFSPEFHIRKSQLLAATKNYHAALTALDEAQKLAPFDEELLLLKTELLIKQKRFDEALTILKDIRLNTFQPNLEKVYYLESFIHEGNQQHTKMLHALRRAVLLNPYFEQAFERLWFITELYQIYEPCIKIYQKVLEKDAYSWPAWYNLGHCYACLEQYQESAEAYDFALTINEEFEYVYRDYAQVCIELGAHQKALDLFLAVMKKFEADSDLFRCIGECYQALDAMDQSRYYFRKSIKKDPANDIAHFKLGLCLIESGHWHRAIPPLEAACDLNDLNEEYVAALAHGYAMIDHRDKALKQFQKATEMAPENEEYWIELIQFLYDWHKYENALEIIDEAEINTGGSRFVFFKAACLFELGQEDHALMLFEQGLSENFDHHELIFSLKDSFLKEKKVDQLLSKYLLQGF